MLRARAETHAHIRRFFAERNVLEVTTPTLEPHATNDAGVNNFPAVGGLWLRTSPEYSMKQLIADCGEDIYQLGTVFRNEDAEGAHHRREFTLLEWYRVGWDYKRLMRETNELLNLLFAPRTLGEVSYVRYADLLNSIGINAQQMSDTMLNEQCERYGFAGCTRRDDALDFLTTVVARDFDKQGLTFVCDYPPELAQMAATRTRDGELFAERFEAYIGAVELVNGCSELRDPAECRRRCEAHNEKRKQAGRTLADPTLLYDALERGLPACAGAALGVDRLLMLLLDAATVGEV